jgi:hypothetical protein
MIYGFYVRYFILNVKLDVKFVKRMGLTFFFLRKSIWRVICLRSLTDSNEVSDARCRKTQLVISNSGLLFLWLD